MEVCGPEYIIPFGKHRWKSLDEIADEDPGYIVWLHERNILTVDPGFVDLMRESAEFDEMETWSDIQEF